MGTSGTSPGYVELVPAEILDADAVTELLREAARSYAGPLPPAILLDCSAVAALPPGESLFDAAVELARLEVLRGGHLAVVIPPGGGSSWPCFAVGAWRRGLVVNLFRTCASARQWLEDVCPRFAGAGRQRPPSADTHETQVTTPFT